MKKADYRPILERFVPEEAVDYCLDLWWDLRFEFKITKERQSKLGDFRYHTQRDVPIITVNNNLNRYNFLITYIHEVAHFVVYKDHQHKVQAHGKEWKKNFQRLLFPIMNASIFPDDILRPLARYMKNPKASSYSDSNLMAALQRYDQQKEGEILLKSLKPRDSFTLNNRKFEFNELRRTRVLCTESNTGKKYLISAIARVKLIS